MPQHYWLYQHPDNSCPWQGQHAQTYRRGDKTFCPLCLRPVSPVSVTVEKAEIHDLLSQWEATADEHQRRVTAPGHQADFEKGSSDALRRVCAALRRTLGVDKPPQPTVAPLPKGAVDPRVAEPCPSMSATYFDAPLGGKPAPKSTATLHVCRVCSSSRAGITGAMPEGWRQLLEIDGPNAICPTCASRPRALDALREDFPDVSVGP